MEFKPIWHGIDWELQVNDKDEFKIHDLMTGNSIVIASDDKAEFSELLSRLYDELWEESFEAAEDKE